MVVLARVILLIAESTGKPESEGSSDGKSGARGGVGVVRGTSSTIKPDIVAIDHGDVLKALSGAHLREVGITIKAARPGWQEAHVQVLLLLCVMSVLVDCRWCVS